MRTIHMTAAGLPANPNRTCWAILWGTGGRYAVVDTTHINYQHFDKTGIPQTEAVRNLERFTVNDEGSRLEYSVTITDPAIFTEPVVMTKTWAYRPGETVNPYDCQLWSDE